MFFGGRESSPFRASFDQGSVGGAWSCNGLASVFILRKVEAVEVEVGRSEPGGSICLELQVWAERNKRAGVQ